jgi:hypothetical protein
VIEKLPGDLKAFHSAAVNCITKSAGKRLRLRFTNCSKTEAALDAPEHPWTLLDVLHLFGRTASIRLI